MLGWSCEIDFFHSSLSTFSNPFYFFYFIHRFFLLFNEIFHFFSIYQRLFVFVS